MIVILIGPPGGGKGTQAIFLAEKYRLVHFSVGQLLREEFARGSKIGIEGERFWGEKGINVPTRISLAVLKKHIGTRKNFILDNFPRTKENLDHLKIYLKKGHLKIDFVFHLEVSKKEGLKRLVKRAMEDKKRFGQSRLDETKRLMEIRYSQGYLGSLTYIVKYFRKIGVYYPVCGEDSIKEVNSQLVKIIEHEKN